MTPTMPANRYFNSNEALQGLDLHGFLVLPGVLDEKAIRSVENGLSGLSMAGAGTRNLLARSWCQELSQRIATHPAIRLLLPSSPGAVQCTYFEKSQDQNWLVSLHQDLSIPVRERVDHPELRGWSLKEEQLFVQPPASLLEKLLAVRVHLDDCGADSGPLRVVRGSHRFGRVSEEQARALRDTNGETICEADAGSALVMRPLLLHASSKATAAHHRRVLHFLFGSDSPGYGLQWQQHVAV